MPRISPFTGSLFDGQLVGSLASVTTPPYDTIAPQARRQLLDASPYNIVRVILGEETPSDDQNDNKYTRASRELRRWHARGVLVSTGKPMLYPYEMRFSFRGVERRVRGIICQVDLEPWGGSIVPHEQTLPAPVEDRLALMRAVRTNLSPIYAVFRGPSPPLAELQEWVAVRDAAEEVLDESGVLHRLWLEGAPPDVTRWLADEPLLIADGHHRYTMALRYREEMRAISGPGPWDQAMMLVVDATSEDPPVLPIHRLVRTDRPPDVDGPLTNDLDEMLDMLNDDDLTFGLIVGTDDGLAHVVGRLEGLPPTVCALHEQVLADTPAESLRYVTDPHEAERAVRRGEASAAYVLPPTKVERIRSVVERGERLPQKSTFFWPKPRTGMVIRPLEDP